MTSTMQHWLDRVVMSAKPGLSQDQIEAVARRCHDAELSGFPSNVWHEVCAELGMQDRCPCFACYSARSVGRATSQR